MIAYGRILILVREFCGFFINLVFTLSDLYVVGFVFLVIIYKKILNLNFLYKKIREKWIKTKLILTIVDFFFLFLRKLYFFSLKFE